VVVVHFPWPEVTVQLPDEVVADLQKRLRRAEGQVRAVQRMLDEGQECRDVLVQLTAATKALEQTGFKLLAAGLQYCVTHPDEAAASGYPLAEVERLFMKLA
jgi:DNA-binding FrmR family transcriptional regulator